MSHNVKHLWIQSLASIIALLIGAALIYYFVATKKPVAKSEPARQEVPVETLTARAETVRLPVRVKGTVKPARALSIASQVRGRLIEVHDHLKAGGLLAEGELLARVEPDDYALAVREAQARLEEAEARLALEEGRQAVAKDELEFIQDRVPKESNQDLILRVPQERINESAVKRASVALEQAKLNAGRTEIRTPFNCVVFNENVEVGQVVLPGNPIAEIQGTDLAWVEARIPINQVELLGLESRSGEENQGVQATVTLDTGFKRRQRKARVLRLTRNLDPAGHMAGIILVVEDPFNLQANGGVPNRTPLYFGAYVEVEIQSPARESVISVPAEVLRNRERLYVANDAGKLEIRQPEILLRNQERLYITAGLEDGEEVITTLISNPVEGMRLKRIEPASADSPETVNANLNGSQE